MVSAVAGMALAVAGMALAVAEVVLAGAGMVLALAGMISAVAEKNLNFCINGHAGRKKYRSAGGGRMIRNTKRPATAGRRFG